MARIAVVLLLLAVAWALILAPAEADRPLSDVTCARGELATYDEGRHHLRDRARVLGCVRLASGGRLQVDASRQAATAVCLWLTGPSPPTQGLYACPGRRGLNAARALLILRRRSSMPSLVVGIAPAEARSVAVTYRTPDGAHERARARLIRAGGRLADRIGAPRAFGAFLAELGPDVDVCRGIEPRAVDRIGTRVPSQSVVPMGKPLPRRDGWLAGFAPSYGLGLGSGDAPRLCHRGSRERSPGAEALLRIEGNEEPVGGGDPGTAAIWWVLAGAGVLSIALGALARGRRLWRR